MNNPQTAFTDNQFDSIYPEGIENHYWNRSRNRIIQKFLRKYNPENKPALEIGCGRGIVVKFLKDCGFQITGCDLANFLVEEKYRDILFPQKGFADLPPDLITSTHTVLLLDVLEHLEYPDEFLKSIASTFPFLKTVIITVPSPPELWSNYDEFNGHFRRYSMKDLQETKLPGNFVIADCQYLFHLLYWPARIQVKFRKQRNTEINPPVGLQKKVHALISGVLRLEAVLFPKKWKGTSLLMILQKDNRKAGR